MVYYYQIVSKPLTSRMLTDETCPVCNKRGTLQLTLSMRYISALVPFYGMGRTTSVCCRECNHVVKVGGVPVWAKRKYPESIAHAIKDIRATHKRTLWQLLYPWSGCWLILGLAGLGLTMKLVKQYKDGNVQEILANPRPGDIYKSMWNDIATARSEGALVKVVRVSGDTLVIVHSRDMIDPMDTYSKEGWAKLSDDDDAFEPKEYKVRLPDFKENTSFREFDTQRDGPLGNVLGLGRSNYAFDVVERK